MAEIHDMLFAIDAPGISVVFDQTLNAASLRYFDANGAFAHAVQASLGMQLPGVCRATCAPEPSSVRTTILAWRSPTETVLLSADPARIANLQAAVGSGDDGCIVDQSGGLLVLRAQGERIVELLARTGGQAVLPTLEESRRSRQGEIPVLVIKVELQEMLLVVERAYAEHLMNWLRVSAADFAAGPTLSWRAAVNAGQGTPI